MSRREAVRRRAQQFAAFRAAVGTSGRYPKADLQPPADGGNVASISGEVSSQADHAAIVELARQHGFQLLADGLVIPCRPDE